LFVMNGVSRNMEQQTADTRAESTLMPVAKLTTTLVTKYGISGDACLVEPDLEVE